MSNRFIFDPTLPYMHVNYLRMSTDMQNPRSPDQQHDTIEETKTRGRRPWRNIGEYRDNGVSGKYAKKRAGFDRMIRDIKSGKVPADLILVDSYERFGRSEEVDDIRRDLFINYGVLVLTADSNFEDPTTFAGSFRSSFESARAREHNRIKAHDVARGRRDAVRRGHWPGGKVATGLKPQRVFIERKGHQEHDHSILVHDPETCWMIRYAFLTAFEKGWGSTKVARAIQIHPDTPDRWKRISSSTVNRWFENTLYIGVFTYNQLLVEIHKDVRIQTRNSVDDFIINPNFCEPLISKEVWDVVQLLRNPRVARGKKAKKRKGADSKKLIRFVRPGTSIRYLLSGLVCCAECSRSMVPRSGQPYTRKDGTIEKYTAYVCPGRYDNLCPNRVSVKEYWLRSIVVQLVKDRLLPSSTKKANGVYCLDDLVATPWFNEISEEVQLEFKRIVREELEGLPLLEQRQRDLERQQEGWRISLGNPNLPLLVRQTIETDLANNAEQMQGVTTKLANLKRQQEQLQLLVDPKQILQRINDLAQLLASDNPTRVNLELSHHIDAIYCHKDGQVRIRTCRLGALAESQSVLAEHTSKMDGLAQSIPDGPANTPVCKIKPRRRTVRDVRPGDNEESNVVWDRAYEAADPNRFAHLGPQWFWEDIFRQPEPTFWAKEYALTVLAKREETKWSIARLASEFSKSPATIRKALQIGEELNMQNESAA